MTFLILLFVIGILLLVAEVIVPGGILGTIGGLMMFAGCALAFMNYGSGWGMIAVLVALVLGGLAIYLELAWLPKTKWGKRAFLHAEVAGVSAAFGEDARSLVGKTAEAVTMLSPSGYILVDGRRYEAFCQSGQVPAGSPLEIIGADNFRLIVTPRPTL